MSNIYITEPPTNGKVLLNTSVGDIEIELWSKECPKAARNFVQLCLEGYYDRTVFHRLVPDFIVQGGDPTGTGEGGESIYGKPFRTEVHSRLRFNRRGLVAMSATNHDDNRSQFFFTLGPTPELERKHTIFGKIVGNTLFNMLNLANGEIDQNERPLHLHRIFRTEIIINPFPDIVPRVTKKVEDSGESNNKKQKSTARATKNFSLLSFGEEAEEEEEELSAANQTVPPKMMGKSSHDLLDDPRLSKNAVTVKKLKDDKTSNQQENMKKPAKRVLEEEEEKDTKIDQKQKVRDEITELKRNLALSRHQNKKPDDIKEKKPDIALEEKDVDDKTDDPIAAFKAERKKFKDSRSNKRKKVRESDTMDLFSKFRDKLKKFGVDDNNSRSDSDGGDEDSEEKSRMTETYLKHRMVCEEKAPVLAMDASSAKDHERYDLYDPRNSLNKRRRKQK